MQVSVENTSNLERRMTVEVPGEQIEKEMQSRFKSLASRAKIDGFRPGKVPMRVIMQKFGSQVRQEVMGEVLQTTFYEAVTQEKLRPAGTPHIDPNELKEGEDFSYIATFEVYPVIELTDLSDVEIEKVTTEVTGADIDRMLEVIRKQRADWKEADDAAVEGDKLTVDYEGSIDGVAFDGGTAAGASIEIGANRMIPGFETQLIGAKANENRTISVTFPDEYHARELAGKVAEFAITVQKVETPVLPDVDDVFLESFGLKEGGIDALKQQIKTNMGREAEQIIKGKLKTAVMDALYDKNPIEIPKALVDPEMDRLLKQQREQLGITDEQQKDRNVPEAVEQQARRRVVLGLLLAEVVSQNDLKVAPDKLRQTIESIASGYQHPEEVIKYYYGDKKHLAEMENLALEEITIDWILAQATVNDVSTSFEGLTKGAS